MFQPHKSQIAATGNDYFPDHVKKCGVGVCVTAAALDMPDVQTIRLAPPDEPMSGTLPANRGRIGATGGNNDGHNFPDHVTCGVCQAVAGMDVRME